ncbi:MAG: methylmalonyl-CoA carboxyltransferase [Actinobacteria bacterium]|nr:methylmalonyl-CoA carboxyltransferase [Actinomycetota bacterium]
MAWFRLAGGKHHGAVGQVEGEVLSRLVTTATDIGVPIVGVLDTSGAEVAQGVVSLHAWGTVARALVQASGVVPIVLVVVGPCVSGPSLLLGIADVVVMTSDAFAYVSGPGPVAQMTGVDVSHDTLGGAATHGVHTGVAALVAADEDEALEHVRDVLAFLPANNMEEPPRQFCDDPADRDCATAAVTVPASASMAYDVRVVIADVVDDGCLLELRARHAGNVVTALATIEGAPVGVIANQACQLAGTLDIAASQKAARFVQFCDAFNLPLVTFVDTPGFQPGKDIEWRGMIRHGAQLVHAYAAATVPRVSVMLRKAYGGAFIVMDSKGLGNDACFAWPDAELAVMGAPGAVQVLHGKRIKSGEIDDVERLRLEDDYAAQYCNPTIAAQRGYVDDVISATDTRRAVAFALRALRTKREHLPQRRHSNGPL